VLRSGALAARLGDWVGWLCVAGVIADALGLVVVSIKVEIKSLPVA
jgi:hypothetical protein